MSPHLVRSALLRARRRSSQALAFAEGTKYPHGPFFHAADYGAARAAQVAAEAEGVLAVVGLLCWVHASESDS